MKKDVFISYSNKDKEIAEKICFMLEQKGLKCWIALRDAVQGIKTYPEQIVEAIESTSATVLLLSDNSNVSNHVGKEIENAVSNGKPIFPVRIKNVLPSKQLVLFISTYHWLDAWMPPIEQKINQLADSISAMLGGGNPPPRLITKSKFKIFISETKYIFLMLASIVILFIIYQGISSRMGKNKTDITDVKQKEIDSIPLTSSEIEKIKAQYLSYAAKIEGGLGPAASSIYNEPMKSLVNQLIADERYEKQIPRETALIYRMYGATFLFTQSSDILSKIKDALPWITRAVRIDKTVKDFSELENAESYLNELATGKVPNVDAKTLFTHEFRVAMPEANDSDVEKQAQTAIDILKGLISPDRGGVSSPSKYSAKDDYEYLFSHQVGRFQVGKVMEVIRMESISKYPNIDVGGKPTFFPLPNGNTKVLYKFTNGFKTLSYEWEVNKSKKSIIPLTDAAKEIMTLK
jgi:hypothetical protein